MTQGNIFNSFAQSIQGGHAMKDRFRFWGLYCGLILSFVLHYFATSQLKIYENHLWELFDSPKATIIMYLGNGLHAIYYVVAFLLMLFLCNTKNFKIIEELIFLALPALLLLVTGSIMTNLFIGCIRIRHTVFHSVQCCFQYFCTEYMHMKLEGSKKILLPSNLVLLTYTNSIFYKLILFFFQPFF